MEQKKMQIPDGYAFYRVEGREAWWQRLGWQPDWTDVATKKYCLFNNKGKIDRFESFSTGCVLAFPAEDVREQFLEAFGDLIEEAKELI